MTSSQAQHGDYTLSIGVTVFSGSLCNLIYMRITTNKQITGCLYRPHVYLEGSHTELDTEAQVNTEVVGQKIEEHVVSTKQRDEEKRGLSQASVAQKQRNKMQEVKYLGELLVAYLI